MRKLLTALIMISLSTIMIAKEIDITKEKGTNQEEIVSLSPAPMDNTVKRKANIKLGFSEKLHKETTQNSMTLTYLGCQQEKESLLKKRRDKNIQRCKTRYQNHKQLKKACIQCAKLIYNYQKKRNCKKRTINGKTKYLKQKDILLFNPKRKLRPGYYQITTKGLKTVTNKKIKKISYRFEVSKNSIDTITLTPESINLEEGKTTTLSLEAHYHDNTTETVSEDINWIIGDNTIIAIDNNNTLTALKAGKTLLQATYHGKVSQEVEVTITEKPEIINGYTLPPEPDPAINNATLLGVDSNDNGVRDDVERWVIKTFENGGFRNNLYFTDYFLKLAKNHQKRLANEDPTPEEVLKSYTDDKDSWMCIVSVNNEEEEKNYFEKSREYKDKIFNTHERLELFFVYEKRLPMREYYRHNQLGGTTSELQARRNACKEAYINFKGGE